MDEDFIYLASDMYLYVIAQEYPIRAAFEGYLDLDYRDDRSVSIPKEKGVRNPDLVAARLVRMVTEETVESRSGEPLDVPADSICVHGDTPNLVS